MIRKALAEMAPLGQKTVRGSLNEMIHDADEVQEDEEEEIEEEEEESSEDEDGEDFEE